MFNRKDENGMSLPEIMVAVIVIGILSAIAIAGWSKYRQTAVEAQAETELSSIALEVNDTQTRTMTPQGYKTTYRGLDLVNSYYNSNVSLENNYDPDSFNVKQYHYSGATKKRAEIPNNSSVRHENICVQISMKNKPVSQYALHSIVNNSAQSSKVHEGICPNSI